MSVASATSSVIAERGADSVSGASTTANRGSTPDRLPSAHFEHKDTAEKAGQHKQYYWVVTEEGHEDKTITAEEVLENHGVPEHILLHHINEEREEEAAVKSLPYALVLVILYALMNFNHDSQAYVRSLEQALDYDITENANFAFSDGHSGSEYMGHKNYEDVNAYADFWSWMNKGMTALYFQQDRASSEGSGLDLGSLPLEERQYYLWHNRKIGPLRVMKEVTEHVQCMNERMGTAFGLICDADTQLDLTLDPTDFDVAQIPFTEDSASTVWLQEADYKSKLQNLEMEGWLNNRTYRVQVSFLVYNPSKDILTMSNVHFLFARSGRIWKQLTHRSFKLEAYPSWEEYVWDILFFLSITIIFICELKEACGALAAEAKSGAFSCRNFIKNYFAFWNIVDWISIIMAYAMLIVWFIRYSNIKVLEGHVVTLPEDVAACAAQDFTCQFNHYNELYRDVEAAGHWIRESNLLGAFYPVCIMLRLFKAFQKQPRLALVAMTLYNSSGDLSHFGIVFLATFFSSVIMAVNLFGREMTDFAQFDRSMMTLTRALMGDFDYEDMEINNRGWAFFFVLMFQVAMFLIMLNMLVAIVMDVYAETKGTLTRGESLWGEVFQILQRWWRNKKKLRIPFPVLLAEYEKNRGEHCWKSDKTITVEQFTEIVPGLKKEQARRLLLGAAEDWGGQHAITVDMNEVLSAASRAAELANQVDKKHGPPKAGKSMRSENSSKNGSMVSVPSEASRATPEAPRPSVAASLLGPATGPAPTPAELAAAPGLSLQELVKAAQLRLPKEFASTGNNRDQVKALERILESLRLLSMDAPLPPKSPAGGIRGVGVTI